MWFMKAISQCWLLKKVWKEWLSSVVTLQKSHQCHFLADFLKIMKFHRDILSFKTFLKPPWPGWRLWLGVMLCRMRQTRITQVNSHSYDDSNPLHWEWIDDQNSWRGLTTMCIWRDMTIDQHMQLFWLCWSRWPCAMLIIWTKMTTLTMLIMLTTLIICSPSGTACVWSRVV